MIVFQRDVELCGFHSFGTRAKARLMISSDSPKEFVNYFKTRRYPENLLILGGGSNVLFVASEVDLVLRPCIMGIERVKEDDNYVYLRAGAGEDWDNFVSYTVQEGLSGAENLSLIPGKVGASPVQNIGAYGVEAKDIIEWVEAVNLRTFEERRFSFSECEFGYRMSYFKQHPEWLVTHVCYRLNKHFVPQISYWDLRTVFLEKPKSAQVIRDTVCFIRHRKLPDLDITGSAGSFFKNPVVSAEKAEELRSSYPTLPIYKLDSGQVKLSAAWLIDRVFGKGYRFGRAGIYYEHALILVNNGGSTGAEVYSLANRIIEGVEERYGVRLEPEVRIIQ